MSYSFYKIFDFRRYVTKFRILCTSKWIQKLETTAPHPLYRGRVYDVISDIYNLRKNRKLIYAERIESFALSGPLSSCPLFLWLIHSDTKFLLSRIIVCSSIFSQLCFHFETKFEYSVLATFYNNAWARYTASCWRSCYKNLVLSCYNSLRSSDIVV